LLSDVAHLSLEHDHAQNPAAILDEDRAPRKTLIRELSTESARLGLLREHNKAERSRLTTIE
jgi:hypothetical protein